MLKHALSSSDFSYVTVHTFPSRRRKAPSHVPRMDFGSKRTDAEEQRFAIFFLATCQLCPAKCLWIMKYIAQITVQKSASKQSNNFRRSLRGAISIHFQPPLYFLN